MHHEIPSILSPKLEDRRKKEHTGGAVSYYKVEITHPTSLPNPYTVECNDVIEAMKMTFAEGEAFKALWRLCAARTLGKSKEGDTPVYNAEKIVFFGGRVLAQEKLNHGD